MSAIAKAESAAESRNARWAALALFVLALGLRLLHLREIGIHDPFYEIPSVDGAIYDAWAREILAGDWKGEGVLFLGPLYPIFLAIVYAVFGESLAALKGIQALLGAFTCVLVWGLARELFDHRVAALSGLLAACHRMLIFYGGTVMIVNLQVPLVVGLVWALVRTIRRPHVAGFALCGLLLGLSALARQTVLLVAPLVVLWIAFGLGNEVPVASRWRFAAAFGAMIALLILPFTIRNYVVGGDLVLLNSTGGANFYMGNQRRADGTWQVPSLGQRTRVDNPNEMRRAFARAAEQAEGRPLKPSEISSHWIGRGLAEIAADPVRWIGLELRKLGLFVNAYEVWNNRSVDVSKHFSWLLRLPLVSFGLIAPLGLLGLVVTRDRWRRFVPVYGAIGAYLASALLFFVLSRYRLPATVLFVPFAAAALVTGLDRLRQRDTRFLAIHTVLGTLFAIIVHWPLASENRMHMAYYNLGNKYRELERWDEAVAAYRESLAANPMAISTHNNMAVALEFAGDDEEAIEAWKVVGVMAMRAGDQMRMDRAARHLRDLGILIPADSSPSGTQPPPP